MSGGVLAIIGGVGVWSLVLGLFFHNLDGVLIGLVLVCGAAFYLFTNL